VLARRYSTEVKRNLEKNRNWQKNRLAMCGKLLYYVNELAAEF
jgi:hypothetical protein